MKLQDIEKTGFTVGGRTGGAITFLPEPERRRRHFPFISVDDHIVEPANMFEGRIPAKFGHRGPRVIVDDTGSERWAVDGNLHPNVGFNALVGRPVSEYSMEPTRFEDMRRGSWDIHERIKDMDLNGVYASVNFPSSLVGFGGQRLATYTDEPELALAMVRAWNDWHIEEWAGAYPDRIIPLQIPWMYDPNVGAEEIRRNAARGFKAISFCEAPDKAGFPSLHTGHWDPMIRACEETGTVICLHVGSSGTLPSTSDDAPADAVGVLFFAQALFVAVDWLYSMIPLKFPKLKICLSEGGISWVAGLLDRLDHVANYQDMYGTWTNKDESPAEVFQRTFWHCAIDDTSSFCQRDRIGVDKILLESDYPHCDTTWPNTQERLWKQIEMCSREEIEKMTWRTASELFRHPVPVSVQQDPESF